MTAPEGDFRMSGAYIDINLRDNTEADEQKIRSRIEDGKPVQLKAELDKKSLDDVEAKVKAGTKAIGDSSPVKAKVELDAGSVAAFEARVKAVMDSASGSSTVSAGVDSSGGGGGAASGAAAGGAGLGQGALIAAGLGVGAGAVGGVALLTIPAAFAAIGIAAEKSSPQVVQAFGEMSTAGKKALTDGFAPYAPVLAGLATEAKTTLTGLEPEFHAAAVAGAPLLQLVGHDFLAAAQAGVGDSVPILQGMRPVAQALGDDFTKAEQGIAGLFRNLDVGQAEHGLAAVGTVVKDDLPAVGNLINEIAPLGTALLNVLAPAAATVVNELGFIRPVTEGAGAALQFLSPAISAAAGPVLGLVTVSKLLTGSWTDFSGVTAKLKSVMQDSEGEFDRGKSTLDSLAKTIGINTAATKEAAVADAQLAADKAALADATAKQGLVQAQASVAASNTAKTRVALAEAEAAETVTAREAAAAQRALTEAEDMATFSMGPLGIALGVVGGALALVGLNSGKATAPTSDLTNELVRLGKAAPDATQGILDGDPALTDLVNKAKSAGVSVTDLLSAYSQGPQALQGFSSALGKQNQALGDSMIGISEGANNTFHQVADLQKAQDPEKVRDFVAAVNSGKTSYDLLDPSLKKVVETYNAQTAVQNQLGTSITTLNQRQDAANAIAAHAADLTKLTGDQQLQATGIAGAFGISIDTVAAAFRGYVAGASYSLDSTQKLSEQFLSQTLAVASANQTIGNYFKTADAGVTSASQSLADANHSAAASADAVASASHSLAQSAQAVTTAQQGVALARRGVTDALASEVIAENNVEKAQVARAQAQINLNIATQQAVEQLKALHLQLADQGTSETSARLALFDQARTSGALGITSANAQAIAGQTITTTNEAQVKSANDLLKAQQALADTLNTGANLRVQVTAADKAGVNGAPGVIAANQAIVAAQDQVTASNQALLKAHQAVDDARANVLKAEQGVSDALYNEAQARKAVSDALYNEQKATQAVAAAKLALQVAQDADSHSMDISTAAGQRNFAMLQQVSQQLFANESPQQAANDLVKNTAKLFDTTTTSASNYLKQLGLIPQSFQFGITAVASADLSELNNAYSTILGRGAHATPGLPVPFAEGGAINGVGGPTEDANLILASRGEFMQPTDSHDYYGTPFMEAIRQKKIPKSLFAGYATGGAIGEVYDTLALGAVGDFYQTAANALGVLGVPSPPRPKSLPPYVSPAFGGGSYSQFAGSPDLEGWIQAAIGRTGVPQSWDGPLHVLIGRESGGNPNAINRTDSNAQRGDPSRGLMQTIGATFEHYRDRSLPDNIYDPVANIVAGIHYIEADYGSIFNVQQANPNLPPRGYDTGGRVPPGDTLVRNATGRPETMLPPKMGDTLDAIHAAVQGGDGARTPTRQVSIHNHITVKDNDTAYTLAHKVTAQTSWDLMTTVGG